MQGQYDRLEQKGPADDFPAGFRTNSLILGHHWAFSTGYSQKLGVVSLSSNFDNGQWSLSPPSSGAADRQASAGAASTAGAAVCTAALLVSQGRKARSRALPPQGRFMNSPLGGGGAIKGPRGSKLATHTLQEMGWTQDLESWVYLLPSGLLITQAENKDV